MKALIAFAWVAGFTALALFCILEARLCQWFIVWPAVWGGAMAIWTRTAQSRQFLSVVAVLAAGYALLIGAAWGLAGVKPDLAYLGSVGPYLLAGLLAPAVCLETGPLRRDKWKWIWLGLFLGTGAVIEANNLGLIDYRSLHAWSFRAKFIGWTEKYYVYWLLLLVWACVAFFSRRRQVDRLVILGLLGLTAMLIWCSGRTARALGFLACGVAVYALLSSCRFSPRQLRMGVGLVLLWWVAAPWTFTAVDLSRWDPRVEERTQIYRATHDFIMQRPWLGYGFGNIASLTHPILSKRFNQQLPGAHAYNLGLRFWLEYGLVGVLFLCAVTWELLRRVIDRAHDRECWPALAAMIVSFLGMVSFSWEVWECSIILFYAAFAGLVILILNQDDDRREASNPTAGIENAPR